MEVEDAPIRSNNDLILALERRSPGQAVELGLVRAGKATRLHVVLDAAQ